MRRTVALALAVAASLLAWAAEAPQDWVTVEYAALLDRRELTHSGEPVGVLLGRQGDARADALLEPVLERYAFVLPDAFDAMGRFKPRVELGRLWPEGGREPGWVELLRARRYVVESDGAGGLRAFLPVPHPAESEASSAAAEAAWRDAWPVLRHVLAAERRRRPGKLAVEVYPYAHDLAAGALPRRGHRLAHRHRGHREGERSAARPGRLGALPRARADARRGASGGPGRGAAARGRGEDPAHTARPPGCLVRSRCRLARRRARRARRALHEPGPRGVPVDDPRELRRTPPRHRARSRQPPLRRALQDVQSRLGSRRER
jgi:hypothetical protein